MTILIVDDEPDVLDTLEEFFAEEGFIVVKACDGQKALDYLKHGELPCVVILDLIMPHVNGNQVYADMRSDPRLAAVPVVISTSDPSRAPSGVAVLRKPVNLNRLLGAVKQYCHCS